MNFQSAPYKIHDTFVSFLLYRPNLLSGITPNNWDSHPSQYKIHTTTILQSESEKWRKKSSALGISTKLKWQSVGHPDSFRSSGRRNKKEGDQPVDSFEPVVPRNRDRGEESKEKEREREREVLV